MQETPSAAAPGPEEPVCPDSWTSLEKWIWEKLQAGVIANIDKYKDKGRRLPPANPRKPEDWQDGRRRLTSRFLEDLLLREPYCTKLHHKGLRIEGAWFDEDVDLEWAEVTRPIRLTRCRFKLPVRLTGLRTPSSVFLGGSAFAADLGLELAKVGGLVDLRGAKVAGKLDMDSADIGQSLLMASNRSHQAEFNEVVLRAAKVGGQVALIGAKVDGKLDMDAVDIGQLLLMRSELGTPQAEFKEVDLRGAKVSGLADLRGAKVGKLLMDEFDVGQSLLMASNRDASRRQAKFNKVVLTGAKVGGLVDLRCAKVAGKLDMDSADIRLHLLMASDRGESGHQAKFNEVVLTGAKVGGKVDLRCAKVAGELNMDSANIGLHLLMASDRGESHRQAEFNKVVLTGAKVGGKVALDDVWPPDVELDGFTYQHFGGHGAGAEADVVASLGSAWFVKWLRKGESYTPQPYQQCAQVLREMGHPEMANDVLYGGREREREQAFDDGRERERKLAWRTGDILRGTGLTLLKWFVGYGYGSRLLWRPLGWALVIIVVGAFLPEIVGLLPADLLPEASSRCADDSQRASLTCQTLGWRFLFSLDMLLPIVELSREHSTLQAELDGIAYVWFVVQRLLGWVLALFLIAGLTGLTK